MRGTEAQYLAWSMVEAVDRVLHLLLCHLCKVGLPGEIPSVSSTIKCTPKCRARWNSDVALPK